MTIYILPPEEIDDKALGKMISAIAQVLCQVHYLWINYHAETLGEAHRLANKLPKHNEKLFDNINNQWSKWGYECLANYNALLALAKACCEEWLQRFSVELKYSENPQEQFIGDDYKRYGPKYHKHHNVIEWCESNKPKLPLHAELPSGGKKEQWPLVTSKKYIINKDIKPLHKWVEVGNTMASYRYYYSSKINNKSKWTRRQKPEWLGDL